MKISLHTHTARCNHAFGNDEEYVKAAIAEGLNILGFADHAPMRYKGGFVSTYKMLPTEIDDYFSSIISLREKYKGEIDIKIGFETEYYPSLWEDSLAFWADYPLDYLILGQHFAPEEISGTATYMGRPTGDKNNLFDYTDMVIRAMNTGKILYVAHPDLVNFTGDAALYKSEMRRLINEAKSLSIPLEYNLLGLSTNRNYPNPVFWELVSEIGAKVVIGCDSHSPDRVANKDELFLAEKNLSNFGLTPIEISF